jgi:hypothetical protein
MQAGYQLPFIVLPDFLISIISREVTQTYSMEEVFLHKSAHSHLIEKYNIQDSQLI